MKFKPSVLLVVLVLVLSACKAPASSSPSQTEVPPEQQGDAPTPIPNTPAPAEINAPLVESPAFVSIHFLTERDGWGVTETQIVRTNDGGVTWYNVTPPNVTETGYNAEMSVHDNAHVWVHLPDFANYPNSGFLYRTSDGGITWTNSTTPFSGSHVQRLDANGGWALADLGQGAGSNAVAVYQTTDGGTTWDQKYINDPNSPNASDSLPLGGLKYGIAPLDFTSAWIYGVVYEPGTAYLYRTNDAGRTWEQVSIPSPPASENAELTIEQVRFVTPQNAWLSMRFASDQTRLAIYTSNDAGNTWTLTSTLIPSGGSADFLSATEAVIYNGDQFYVTHDAARTWSIIPPDVKFGETFAMMDFVNVSTGWIVTADPTTDHRTLYRTSDGGLTWSPVIP